MKNLKLHHQKKRLGIKSLEAQGLTNETLQLRTPPPRASFHTRRGGPLRTPWHPIADRGRLPPFNLGRGSRPRHRILLPPGLGVESWNDPPWSWVMSRQLSKELEPLEKIVDSIFRKRPIHLISSGSWCWCLDSEKEGLHTTRYLTLGDKTSTNLSCFWWRHSLLQF